MNRRNLFRLLWGGIAALAAWPVLRFITWREPQFRTVRFSPQELQGAGVIYKDEVFLLPAGPEGSPVALSARCSHLGCLVSYFPAQEEFHCPCHQSIYDRQGHRLSGPTEKGLAHLPSELLEDGALAVKAPV